MPTAEHAELCKENNLLKESLTEMFHFLIVEQGWEFFRAEMLFFSDKKKQSSSEENARKIGNFIKELSEKAPSIEECRKEAIRRAR